MRLGWCLVRVGRSKPPQSQSWSQSSVYAWALGSGWWWYKYLIKFISWITTLFWFLFFHLPLSPSFISLLRFLILG